MIGSTSKQGNGGVGSFFDDEFLANPYPRLAQLREQGPVVPFQKLFGRQLWLVTQYDEAVSVLKDQRFSVNWQQMFSGPVAWIAGRLNGMGRFGVAAGRILIGRPSRRRDNEGRNRT